MMKTLLATAAALTASTAALAVPAHADDHWTATATTECAADLAVLPAANTVSPFPLSYADPTCGDGSLLHHGHGH